MEKKLEAELKFLPRLRNAVNSYLQEASQPENSPLPGTLFSGAGRSRPPPLQPGWAPALCFIPL